MYAVFTSKIFIHSQAWDNVAYHAVHCLICKTLTANGGFSSQAGSRWQRFLDISSELIAEGTRLSLSDSRPFWKLRFLHESSQDVSWYSGGQSVTGGQTSYMPESAKSKSSPHVESWYVLVKDTFWWWKVLSLQVQSQLWKCWSLFSDNWHVD